MTQPAPTFEQLVANMAAARQAYAVAKAAKDAAMADWNALLVVKGITPTHTSQSHPGRPAPTPTPTPSSTDLNVLGTTLATTTAAEKTALDAVNAARAAHAAALVAAGAQ